MPSDEAPSTPAAPNADMQRVLLQWAALGGRPLETLTAAAARRQPRLADAAQALLIARGKPTAPEVVGRVENAYIAGADGGTLPVRVYWPAGAGPFPMLVWFHDGGFVIGNLEQGDAAARALTNAAHAIVVAPGYRQGPEHRFPAAHDDAWVAWRWALAHGQSFGADVARVAVGGEGAGGNLAASVALRARDEKTAAPVRQVLVSPIVDVSLESPSNQLYLDARPLGTTTLPWLFSQYLKSPIEGVDPRFSLLRRQSLEGVAPATIVTAEIDPLRSQARDYAERLRKAGVAVHELDARGVTHGFFGLPAVLPEAREAVRFVAADLRVSFGGH